MTISHASGGRGPRYDLSIIVNSVCNGTHLLLTTGAVLLERQPSYSQKNGGHGCIRCYGHLGLREGCEKARTGPLQIRQNEEDGFQRAAACPTFIRGI